MTTRKASPRVLRRYIKLSQLYLIGLAVVSVMMAGFAQYVFYVTDVAYFFYNAVGFLLFASGILLFLMARISVSTPAPAEPGAIGKLSDDPCACRTGRGFAALDGSSMTLAPSDV